MIAVEWMFVQVDAAMFLLSVAIFFKQNMYEALGKSMQRHVCSLLLFGGKDMH